MNWIQKNFKTIVYTSFLVPIITVAFVSISHVMSWYNLTNPVSWAIYLSFGIEIAALSSLAALTANMGTKVYLPFAVVTLIQFIGNIYYSFNQLSNESQNFREWVELVGPIFEFLGVDPTDIVAHKRILAFLSGGILPIISLMFLHLLVSFEEKDKISNKTNLLNENDLVLDSTPETISENINDTSEIVETISEEKPKSKKLVYSSR